MTSPYGYKPCHVCNGTGGYKAAAYFAGRINVKGEMEVDAPEIWHTCHTCNGTKQVYVVPDNATIIGESAYKLRT